MSERDPCERCGQPLPEGREEVHLCPTCLRRKLFESTLRASQMPGGFLFTPPPPSELDACIPHCKVLELVGKGGMGAVYKARQAQLGRDVAIKILPLEGVFAGPHFAERFKLEAQAMARLNHPNIVSIYDFGEAEAGHFYILMEFVDGVSLQRMIRSGGMTPTEALKYIPQICEALQYAHGQGVVHRDVKPSNILVDREGRVKMTDFGIAKVLEPDGETDEPLTLTGRVLGTLGYMAPEQLQNGKQIDSRADIYSLGVLLYESLTGSLPQGAWEPPSQRVGVSVKMDDVVQRALKAEPDERYQTADDIRTDVEGVIRHQELISNELSDEWAEEPPVQVGFVGTLFRLAVIAAIVAGGVFLFFKFGKEEGSDPPEAAEAGDPAEASAPFRTFTNREGKTFEGRTVAYYGEAVRLEDRDGKSWDVPVAVLSDEDRDHVRDWIESHADLRFAPGVSLDVELQAGGNASTYGIAVKNRSAIALKRLVMEYRLFHRKADGEIGMGAERVALDTLDKGKSQALRTKPFRGEGLAGFWIRVYGEGETVLAEFRQPDMEVESWDGGSGKKS